MKPQKILIFDSGPLISLTMNGLLYVIEKLKKKYPEVFFVITPQVKQEIINRPMRIKKYELEAVTIENLLKKKVLTLSSELVPTTKLQKLTQEVLNYASSVLRAKNEKISPIQEGEASCLAFAKICSCDNLLVVDERTTRLMSESPENLKLSMEKKIHINLTLDKSKQNYFKDFKFIRSSELLIFAYQENLIDLEKSKNVLDALLYSVKFTGTTISSNEIEEAKRLLS